MPNFWASPGIRFNDCVFAEPTPLAHWVPPVCAGLFVILARDIHWSPKPFRPLYFGEFGNNEPQGLNSDGWLRPRGGAEGWFVATLALPFSTTAHRCALRNELVQAYNPIYQSEFARTSTRELARKLETIEVRQHEQNTQIIALLHQLNRLLQPQAVPLKRPIGFLPQPGESSSPEAAVY